MSSRARQDSHHDKRRDKQEVHDNQQYPHQIGTGAADAELKNCGDDSVEDGSGENAFYGAVGACGAAIETDNFGDADGEED